MVRIPSKIERLGALTVERSVSYDDATYLAIDSDDRYAPIHIANKELTEALRDALGWVVIDKPLPEVKRDEDGDYDAPEGVGNITSYVWQWTDTADIEAAALWLLAVVRDRGTLDTEAVNKVATIIETLDDQDSDLRDKSPAEIARALVQAGVRPPEDDN